MTSYRYQAIGPLQAGEGSRAFLGLAISPDNKARPVVIIWVPEAAEKDPALLAKIKRETEHAAQLDHPHIVTVIGFGKLDEGHARVVEFADGESLRKILDTCKKVSPRIATRIILDACTAIHYAHVAGNDDGNPLVHGDLRPETILISFNGVTKITGYGALAFAPREIGGQRVKGRRVHSAPEQIIGGRDAMTIPTDVYLLGVTFYECLTGQVPWSDQGDYFDHAVLTLPLPPATPGEIPPEFQPIIEKAVSKKAHDRYPTPLAMREAIEAAAGDNVATDEELAQFLETLFPQSHQVRAARRHTIDAGIADFVRRQWSDQERRDTSPMMRAVDVPESVLPMSKPLPPPPRSVLPGPQEQGKALVIPVNQARPPPPPADALKKPPAKAAWTQPEEDDDKKDDGSPIPWIIALALFIAVIAGWWAWKKTNEPIPGIDDRKPTVAVVIDAGLPEVIDAGEAIASSSIPDASVEVADAAVAVIEAPVIDAGAVIPTVVAPVASEYAVTIESSPNLDLVIDGKVVGRTPWSGTLPPGKKTFTLQSKSLGISATRSITVKNEAVSESYTFEKGFVAVKAPEGAVVFIDGNRIGNAPIKGEVPVYEGSHRIQVTVGQSKWSEPFTLYGGQRVSFNVELQ